MRFAPIEYVIVRKLQYYRMGGSDRHRRDIAHMIQVSGSDVDWPSLGRWIARLGLGAEWARAASGTNAIDGLRLPREGALHRVVRRDAPTG